MPFQIHDVCRLPTSERPIRLAEFDALLTTATSVERDAATRLTFAFHDADDVHARATDLTARESSCCSFFSFDVARAGGEVLVGIQVSDRHVGILDALESTLA